MKKINNNTVVCISIAEKPGNFGANFHNTSYDILGMNWVYFPREITNASDLEGAIHGVRSFGIRGCSVSMPYKEKVIQYVDEMDTYAERIGAVNTILQTKNNNLKGYNTDFYGAKTALETTEIKGKDVLLIGAGGVAKAVGLAVTALGGILTISNRTYDKAKELSEKLDAKVIPWEQINNSSGFLLINATSVGMKDPNKMIVNENMIKKFNVIMDVVIYPSETKLLKVAKNIGKEIIPGTLMCVYQASKQFKIYTGFNAPEEVIKNTLKAFE